MSDYKYIYRIDQFPNDKYDLSRLNSEIIDSSIIVSLSHLSGDNKECDIYFKASLDSSDWATLSGIVGKHSGEPLPDNHVVNTNIISSSTVMSTIVDGPKDVSGKLRVQQTSRKLGLRVMWTGIGDDTSDISKVGGGVTTCFTHTTGDNIPLVKYIDLNIVENETYLHEGYMTWKDCKLDTLSLQIVPRTVTVSGVSGGDKTVYGGYLVVPTASGSGNYEVVNDLTDPNGGLIYMPASGDTEARPTAYWDADWNSTTHKFENIRPNYLGSGEYNMFSYEVVLAEFIRQIPLLDSGFIPLNSSDTEELGQGMRIKMIADTCLDLGDHDWQVACIICLHRYKSV